MQCLAAKNKKSVERCTKKALQHFKFCGTHMRSKNKRLWITVHNLDRSLIKFQALFRGWLLRSTLKLCGPGVLDRSVCHNDEDVVSCVEKNKLNPDLYFAFEEDEKIFWFDIRTIYHWTSQTLEPTNPYTRQPLTVETRKRLKRVIDRRECFEKDTFHDPQFFNNTNQAKFLWYQIIQTLNENLFADIPETYFSILNEFQIVDLAGLVLDSVSDWKKTKNPVIYKLYLWLEYGCTMVSYDFYQGYHHFLTSILAVIRYHKIQYDFSFKFMSARSILI
jgi:hypothetical protein